MAMLMAINGNNNANNKMAIMAIIMATMAMLMAIMAMIMAINGPY